MINPNEAEELLQLFENKEFAIFIGKVESHEHFRINNLLTDTIKNASEESILDYFKYVETNSIFTPSTVWRSGVIKNCNSRHRDMNYDKQYFNPGTVIWILIMTLRFDIADKLLVNEYAMDGDCLGMLQTVICDDIAIGDDVGAEDEKKIAQWLVGRGDITLNDLPEWLRPDYTGTFTKTNINKLHGDV